LIQHAFSPFDVIKDSNGFNEHIPTLIRFNDLIQQDEALHLATWILMYTSKLTKKEERLSDEVAKQLAREFADRCKALYTHVVGVGFEGFTPPISTLAIEYLVDKVLRGLGHPVLFGVTEHPIVRQMHRPPRVSRIQESRGYLYTGGADHNNRDYNTILHDDRNKKHYY
jgi:hypothetical protein